MAKTGNLNFELLKLAGLDLRLGTTIRASAAVAIGNVQ